MLHRAIRKAKPDESICALQNCQYFARRGSRREHLRRREILAGWRRTEHNASSRRSPRFIWPGASRPRGLLFIVYCFRSISCLASGYAGKSGPQVIGALGWVLFAYQLLGVYVSFNELSGLVRILSVALAICTGWAAWLTRGALSNANHRMNESSPIVK